MKNRKHASRVIANMAARGFSRDQIAAVVAPVDAAAILRQARTVCVTVQGTDDVFYAQVTKGVAAGLLDEADGQLVVMLVGDIAYIDHREGK